MNTKAILGFMLASLIALVAVSSVMAGTLNVNLNSVEVNDVVLGSGTTLAGTVSETVPIVVKFTALEDLQDLKLSVWIDGYKSEVSASTARFDVVNGSTYIKRLTLTLPSVEDMDNLHEGLTLYVRTADKNNYNETSYSIEMERDNYALNLLSIDSPVTAAAGEIIALDIVLKNTGSRTADDTFVAVSIPELGISKKAYFGDLTATDNTEANDNEDARERRIYLAIPADTITGDYTVEIKASNYDVTSTAKKVISITGKAVANSTDTVTPATGKAKLPTSVIVLTVVLVIIFVVLLIVLIVLLTKKQPEKVEDYGETSYY